MKKRIEMGEEGAETLETTRRAKKKEENDDNVKRKKIAVVREPRRA